MPQLRVSCGTSRDSLTVVPVNYDISHPVDIKSDLFEGKITVRIRDFSGDAGKGNKRKPTTESDYFETHPRLSWSMAIQGRFKEELNADDVLYGNVFDKPIRDHLPYGTAAALKFVNYVDPSLQQDIYGDKPWALSPLIATMNHMNIKHIGANGDHPNWSPSQPEEDTAALAGSSNKLDLDHLKGNSDARRAYFAKEENRKAAKIQPSHWISMDFCNGYMDFNTLSLKLPGGLSFSLMRYWDGQPVTYVCRSRDGSKEYFFIVFDIIDEEPQVKTSEKDESKDIRENQQDKEDTNSDVD